MLLALHRPCSVRVSLPSLFGIGIFPYVIRWSSPEISPRKGSHISNRRASRKTDLHHLEGMTEVIQRLEEEGITSTAALLTPTVHC